jgi:hypothetical protein
MRKLLLALLLVGVAACDDSPVEVIVPEAVFEVEVAGERFRIGLVTEEQISRAEQLLASGAENNVHGRVRRGGGGFNTPYGWHLEPGSVSFPDLTMEVCDGRPNSDVQQDITYWTETVKYYCPWGARIVARVD